MRTTFIISAARSEQLPSLGLPEAAFLGRSNVGKSSLLNALVSARIARTSSMPGRTQQINLFRVHSGWGDFALADLPGYGYARVPRAVQAAWGPLVESYLRRRHALRVALLLVDVRRRVEPDDVSVFSRLRHRLGDGKGVARVVVTKLDKVPKSQRRPALQRVAEDMGVSPSDVLGTSARERWGLEVFERLWPKWLGEEQDDPGTDQSRRAPGLCPDSSSGTP